MNQMKKILALLMVFTILVLSTIPISAATNLDLSSKLNVLSKLMIIKDNLSTYNSNTTIKRWEAATIFVRLLGKEAYVIANSQTLKTTGFSDIKPTDPYAPYIGYCAKFGLISSGVNVKFSPNDNITERAFLIIALRALEFQSDVDFTTFSVFNKAYTVGLVTDKSYETRESDSANYLKKDAINVLYNALTIKLKNTKILVIENLINSGVITKDKAFELGITKDITDTAITSVTSLDGTKIRIVINEPFKNLKETDLELFETATPTNKLTTKIDVQADSVIILTTSSQIPNMNYTINIHNISDTYGNIKDLITSSFLGNKDAEIKSDFFKVSKVETIDQGNINLYFTNPVNFNATLPRYYDIYEGNNLFAKGGYDSLAITCLASGNGVSINSKSKLFVAGSDYTIKISGELRSSYGIKLNNGSGEIASFKGPGNVGSVSGTGSALDITNIIALDTKTIEVTFNKELDSFYAKQFLNYSVLTDTSDVIAVNKVILSQDSVNKNKIVRLSLLGTLANTKTYTLTVNFVQDSLKQNSISEGKKQFVANLNISYSFVITNATSVDRSTITVTTDKALDSSLASNPIYYSVYDARNISAAIIPIKATYKSANNVNTVKLYLPPDRPMVAGVIYRVRLARDLQYNIGIGTTTGLYTEYSFTGSDTLAAKTEIEDAAIISQDTILVKLKKEIVPEAPNILTSNYSLEFKDAGYTSAMVPLSVNYIDEKTLVLRFANVDTSIEYTLKYGNLKEYSGIAVTNNDLINQIKVRIGR